MAKKKLSPVSNKLAFREANFIFRSVAMFLTPRFADHQRVESLIKTLQPYEDSRHAIIKDFYKKNNITEDEQIDITHPLYPELMKAIFEMDKIVDSESIKLFTEKEFFEAVEGNRFNFAEKTELKRLLVKE